VWPNAPQQSQRANAPGEGRPYLFARDMRLTRATARASSTQRESDMRVTAPRAGCGARKPLEVLMRHASRHTLAPTLALLAGLGLLQGCNRAVADDAATAPAEDAMQVPDTTAPAADPAPAPSPPMSDPMPPEPQPTPDPTMPPPADGASTDGMPQGDQPQPAEPEPQPVDR